MKALGKLSPEFVDCPFECPNSKKRYDITRREYCDTCPKRQQRTEFERVTARRLKLKLGDEHGFNQSDLETKLYQVIRVQDLSPARMQLKTSFLVSIYFEEKERSREQNG